MFNSHPRIGALVSPKYCKCKFAVLLARSFVFAQDPVRNMGFPVSAKGGAVTKNLSHNVGNVHGEILRSVGLLIWQTDRQNRETDSQTQLQRWSQQLKTK